jgi:hypothetical protein
LLGVDPPQQVLTAFRQIHDRAAIFHLNLANVLQHAHLGRRKGKKGKGTRQKEWLCLQGVFDTSANQVV